MVGAYGLALIGDLDIPKELILYIDNQNILARVTFANSSEICIENEYIHLQDTNSRKWIIQFKEETSLSEFLTELKKANIKTIEKINPKRHDNINKTDNTDTKDTDKMPEQLPVSQTKADILLRMAKMGQPILPGTVKNKNIDIDDTPNSPPILSRKISDSDLNDTINANSQLRNENLTNNNVNEIGALSATHYASNSPSQLAPYVSVYPAHHLGSNLINTAIPSPEFNLFIAENRIQNSEVRMNLNCISSKLDNVLKEISKSREPNTDKLENEFLKSKISDLEKNVSNLNIQLDEAKNSSKCKELEALLKQKDQQLKIEENKVNELQNVVENMQDLQAKVANLDLREAELNEKIRILEEKLSNSEMGLQLSHKTNSLLQETNTTLLQNNEDLSNKVRLLEAKNNSYHEDLNQKVNILSNTIKDSTNLMYQNIFSQFKEPLTQNQIKHILSTNIKRATLDVIRKFQTTLLSPNESRDDDSSVK
ncbi:hypothetical protein AMK59_6184 [Oryctes borbonicus]|uniref:Uncharacterized protein n=1 Tax=Oryctes borbonicus TaxID=1629725 RepID=A0A0T6B0R9_9SCAR|nr:hypothetical protein AMK59_6184 [Oryctes borbonicus]